MLRPTRKQQPSSSTAWISSKSSKRRFGGGGHVGLNPLSLLPRGLIGTCIILTVTLLLVGANLAKERFLDSNDDGNGHPKLRLKLPPGLVGVGGPDSDAIDPNDLSLLTDDSGTEMHLIFSTDCGSYQQWQSYLFFRSAMKVHQRGYVTRIASGCSDEEKEREKQWHEEHIASKMSRRFLLHLTPNFSQVKDEKGKVTEDCKSFNKPNGLKHFFEFSEKMGLQKDSPTPLHDGVVIALLDPDMVLLRPIISDFSNDRETLVANRRIKTRKTKVAPGQPFAQSYVLKTEWRNFDLDSITGSDTPAKYVSQQDGQNFYPAGPPYIGTAGDMYQISLAWSKFVPRVHKQYPHVFADMYAYCIAAAHLKLPHMLIDSLMVSVPDHGAEGWPLVKEIPSIEICEFAKHPDHAKHAVPTVIHYSQHYGVNKSYFGKKKMPHDIFTCDHPPLKDPPPEAGSGKYLFEIPPGKGAGEQKEMTAEKEKLDAFMLCGMTAAVNDASAFFKKNHCGGSGSKEGEYFDLWEGKVAE